MAKKKETQTTATTLEEHTNSLQPLASETQAQLRSNLPKGKTKLTKCLDSGESAEPVDCKAEE